MHEDVDAAGAFRAVGAQALGGPGALGARELGVLGVVEDEEAIAPDGELAPHLAGTGHVVFQAIAVARHHVGGKGELGQTAQRLVERLERVAQVQAEVHASRALGELEALHVPARDHEGVVVLEVGVELPARFAVACHQDPAGEGRTFPAGGVRDPFG
ncbi:hypothetical protein D3C86_1507820 [compost metagenome]